MKSLYILLISIFLTTCLFAQKSDFITIRKHNLPVKTFFAGGYVVFLTSWGEWFNSRIDNIRDDSLFFKEVFVKKVPTIGGGSRLDTFTTGVRKIYYKDIAAIPRKSESFSFIKNGSLLKIIGGGYILLNLVNGTYIHDSPLYKDNRTGFFTATAAFVAGYILGKQHKPYLSIGRKYTVNYIKVKG